MLFPYPLSKSLISVFEKEMRSNQAHYVLKTYSFCSKNASTIRFIMFLASFGSQNNAFTKNATCFYDLPI